MSQTLALPHSLRAPLLTSAVRTCSWRGHPGAAVTPSVLQVSLCGPPNPPQTPGLGLPPNRVSNSQESAAETTAQSRILSSSPGISGWEKTLFPLRSYANKERVLRPLCGPHPQRYHLSPPPPPLDQSSHFSASLQQAHQPFIPKPRIALFSVLLYIAKLGWGRSRL